MAETADLHVFDDAMRLDDLGGGRLRGRTTEPYANMVGPFGGVTAATVLRAIELQPDKHGDPVAMTVNFVTAIEAGELDVATRCVHTSRSTQHWTVEMTQGEQVVVTATAITGVHRDTWSDTEAAPPTPPPPSELEPRGPVPMAWPNQYEMRFHKGPLAGTGQPCDDSETIVWVRDQPERPLDFASLTAIADSFFPRIYVRLGRPIPIGTVSLTVYYHAGADELAAHGTDYLLGEARGSRYERGFFDQYAKLWSPSGNLLATSHQLVYFKG